MARIEAIAQRDRAEGLRALARRGCAVLGAALLLSGCGGSRTPSTALIKGGPGGALKYGPIHATVGDPLYMGLWPTVAPGHRVRILTARLTGDQAGLRVTIRSVSVKQTQPIRSSTIGLLPQEGVDQEYPGIEFFPATDAVFVPYTKDEEGVDWYLVAIITGTRSSEYKITGFAVTYVDLTDGRQGSESYDSPQLDVIFNPPGTPGV